ncbi:MAG: Na/Pi cotransporter family protein [Bdellovibrionales bacterium]|nr:Na/Pi cotransporter family protein [Bdellovibrionales bacterium]
MLDHSSFLMTLGGISIFMLGLNFASENLQKLTANRTRDLMASLSRRPFFGVLVGMLLTLIIQSSGAVTSMLVGLGSAGVFSLQQVMAVILGSTVGTTFTVQLLSLNVAQYGLVIFTFSFSVYFLTKNRTLKLVMAAAMGFGLIFLGLEMIGLGTEALRKVQTFTSFLQQLKENPLLAILATATFTGIVHSSAVTIGFAMSLAASGQITLVDAVYWVYGANIGTTATALLASFGGNYVGRQVAWAHCFYKILSVLFFIPFTEQFVEFVSLGSPQRDVANLHTAFNIGAAAVFYPFTKYGARLIERLFPPGPAEKQFTVKFLERGSYQSASVALAHAEREVLRMADIVLSMVKDSCTILKDESLDLEHDIRLRDDRVDLLNREINLFLVRHMEDGNLVSQQRMMRVIDFSTDLESAADVVDNNILDLARKKHTLKLEFSKDGWTEIQEIHRAVVDVVEMSVSCFQVEDKELAAKIIECKREIRQLERRLREAHIERLVKDRKDSISISSIHLDFLAEFRRIVSIVSNHAYELLKDTDPYHVLPRR